MGSIDQSVSVHAEPVSAPVLPAAHAGSTLPRTDRESMYRVLGFIDDVCARHGIRYFIFGEALKGAVVYQDLVPDFVRVDVGFLREDFERFTGVVQAEAQGTDFTYDGFIDESRGVRRRMARVYVEAPDGANRDLRVSGSEPVAHCIKLSVFDALPPGFDHRKGVFRRMKRLNRRFDRILNAREVASGHASLKDARHLWRVLSHLPRSIARCSRSIDRAAQRYKDCGYEHVTRLAGPRSAIVSIESLVPMGRATLGPVEVSIPADPSTWAVAVDEAAMEDVRGLQTAVKSILVEFDRICREIGVGYFICGGTMLGYVRHGGFIPWDDDMDVAMLREDYDKFRAHAAALLDERFFLQTRESDPNIPYLFTKIRINGTEYITSYNERRDFHKGICLDIFPFDFLPKGETAQREFAKAVRRRARRHHKVVNRQQPEPIYDGPASSLEERWFRFFGKVHRWVYWHIPLTVTQHHYISLATKYNRDAKRVGLDTVGSFTPTYTYASLDDLLPYRDVTFEDIVVKVPNRPEVFLEMQYGDFMQLPPLHKRVGHGLIRWADADAERDNPTTDM